MTLRAALLLVAALAVVAGTGGVSSIQADRGVTGTVAAPHDAYLGLASDGPFRTTDNRTDGVVLATVRNHVGESLSVSVRVVEGDPTRLPGVRNVSVRGTLFPGELAAIRVTVVCEDVTARERFTVDVTVDGASTRIQNASTARTVSCL